MMKETNFSDYHDQCSFNKTQNKTKQTYKNKNKKQQQHQTPKIKTKQNKIKQTKQKTGL